MSSGRGGRRETRDGRALRKVDAAFWATERVQLTTQLRMLEDFVRQNGIGDVIEVPAEECRVLEYRIQCINATLIRAGKDDEASNWVEKRLGNADEMFENWYNHNQEMKMLMRAHQDPSSSHRDAIEGQHKCIDINCKHYVYGFDTDGALRRHISLHETATENQARATSTIRQKTSTMSLDDNVADPENSRQRLPDYDVSNSENERAAPMPSPFQKREELKPMLDHQMRAHGYSTIQPLNSLGAVKSSGPCLRCKVLKKRCDCMSPCKECPHQDILAPDLWKALGCFHGPLSDLSKKSLHSIEECLFKITLPDHRELAFDVSYIKDDERLFWTAELDMLMKSEQFQNLDDQYWQNHATRNASFPTSDLPASPPLQSEDTYRGLLKKYGAAIAVLKAAPKEENQYTHSAFNPFTLLRLGEKLSNQARDHKDWDLYDLAKEFLVAAVHFREEFWKQQASLGPLDKLDADAKHTMTLPDIKTPLATFLRAFDARFTNRKELTVDGWLGSFFALSIVSIIKTVLIDISQATQQLEKQATYAAQLTTIYKVLVSVFSWSAKVSNWCPKEFVELRDPLLYAWASDSGGGGQMVSVVSQQALRETKKMVHQSKWVSSGVKHSKDFLLSLGAGKFLDLGFNGFMVQIFRHKTSERSHHGPIKGLADTPSFTPLQPRHQISNSAMDIDYSEPINVIRPISQLPDDGIRPILEKRLSSGSRRSTFPDVFPSTHRGDFVAEKMPMAPPLREDKWPAKNRLEPIIGQGPSPYRPSGKNYHPRDSTESSDALEDNGYYVAPTRAHTIGTTFTPVGTEAYDPSAAARAKFQRRESRPNLGMHDRYRDAEHEYRDYYRPDINGRREESYRDHPVVSRDDPNYGASRYQAQSNEAAYPPQGGSYYQRTQLAAAQDDLYHKPRRVSPPLLNNPAPPQPQPSTREPPYNGHAAQYVDSMSSRNGFEKGTQVFSLNDNNIVSNRKPKRRELSKEQREQAAAVRRMGACPDCKARKIKCNPEHLGPRKIGACPDCKAKKTKCDPSHHRDEDLRSSTSPQSPSYLVVEKAEKRTRSPSPTKEEKSDENMRDNTKTRGKEREAQQQQLAPIAEMMTMNNRDTETDDKADEEKLVVAAED